MNSLRVVATRCALRGVMSVPVVGKASFAPCQLRTKVAKAGKVKKVAGKKLAVRKTKSAAKKTTVGGKGKVGKRVAKKSVKKAAGSRVAKKGAVAKKSKLSTGAKKAKAAVASKKVKAAAAAKKAKAAAAAKKVKAAAAAKKAKAAAAAKKAKAAAAAKKAKAAATAKKARAAAAAKKAKAAAAAKKAKAAAAAKKVKAAAAAKKAKIAAVKAEKKAAKDALHATGPVSAYTLFIKQQAKGKGKVDLKALSASYKGLSASQKSQLETEAKKNLAKRQAIRQSRKKPASKYALFVKANFPAAYAAALKKEATKKGAFLLASRTVAAKYKQ